MLKTPSGAVFINEDHAAEYAQQKRMRDIERARRSHRAAGRSIKQRARRDNLPHQLELTRRVFNTMIRLLDSGKSCPTCAEPLIDGRYDAGHVRTVASCPQLRFDARNCFGQCRSCNGQGTIRRRVSKTQEAVSVIYQEWILETKGQGYHDWLYGPHATMNLIAQDLPPLRAVFAAEVKRLQRGEQPSRDWRALPQQQTPVRVA
jgi:hypothetical protein